MIEVPKCSSFPWSCFWPNSLKLDLVLTTCALIWQSVKILNLTSTLDLAVALEALLALAHVLGGEVAALRVVHTLARQLRDGALVNIWNNKIKLMTNVLFFNNKTGWYWTLCSFNSRGGLESNLETTHNGCQRQFSRISSPNRVLNETRFGALRNLFIEFIARHSPVAGGQSEL